MTWPLEALIVTGAALVGSFLTFITARRGQKGGDIQFLVTTLMKRVLDLENRVNDLEDKHRADAIIIRRQGDHIDSLEAHIWAGNPPPPPERPDGI